MQTVDDIVHDSKPLVGSKNALSGEVSPCTLNSIFNAGFGESEITMLTTFLH